MELNDVIRLRRSIRKFKKDAIPDIYIKEIIEAARLAPSATNFQPWRFIIVKSEEAKLKLASCTPLPFVTQAPVVLICCVDNESIEGRVDRINELQQVGAFTDTPLDNPDTSNYLKKNKLEDNEARAYMNMNAAIAIEHILLKATDLGLGSCWVMMFSQRKLKKTFNIEDRYIPISLIPIGYSDQNPEQRPRLSVQDIIISEI